MKFKTKLYLFLFGISIFISICTLGIIFVQVKKSIFHQMEIQGISVAASAASVINGDAVEQLRVRADMGKPAYQEVVKFLRNIRNANRTNNVYIKFIYAIYPNPKDPTHFLFAACPEETEKDVSLPGDDDPGAVDDNLSEHLTEEYSSGKLVKDQWGTWLTGYAPIYNSEGKYVATLGADTRASFVQSAIEQLYIYSAIALFISTVAAYFIARIISKKATESLQILTESVKKISEFHFDTKIQLQTNDEFMDLAKAINGMCEGLQEKERLKSGFAHYVSRHILEKIVAKGMPKLEAEKRKITVLFSDIRGFTQMSEKLAPEEVMNILNEYFSAMLEIIFKHSGMLDKLIGDAIMAEFGVPLEDPQQERNAVLCALEMREALAVLRARWKSEGKPEIHAGIGIHTGDAVVGTVGSEDRMEFTAIGDTVNVAARLESATRDLNEEIIISEETLKALGNEFPTKPLGPLQLHGREVPVTAYSILPLK